MSVGPRTSMLAFVAVAATVTGAGSVLASRVWGGALPGLDRSIQAPALPLGEPVTVQGLSDGLAAKLKATPHAYFRFVNRAWTQAVCTAFAGDVADGHFRRMAVSSLTRLLNFRPVNGFVCSMNRQV